MACIVENSVLRCELCNLNTILQFLRALLDSQYFKQWVNCGE